MTRFVLLLTLAALCCSAVSSASGADDRFAFLDRFLGPPAPTSSTPHPAVARIVVEERDGIAYGSGSLIDVREQYGLVITNWHVIRDAAGPIEVRFPGGFKSEARAIKRDDEWDLAALVIWKPPVAPVKMTTVAPKPGDALTICGYGSGQYRAIAGVCTQYYSPKVGLPLEWVELDVQARQGDSGGPIFNDRGELAGVLFGAGQGTTLGSFGPRVHEFLATLAPNLGDAQSTGQSVGSAIAQLGAPQLPIAESQLSPRDPFQEVAPQAQLVTEHGPAELKPRRADSVGDPFPVGQFADWNSASEFATLPASESLSADFWYEDSRTLLALLGISVLTVQAIRLAA
jgi:hypothetical protein